jgi:hypothetical protein
MRDNSSLSQKSMHIRFIECTHKLKVFIYVQNHENNQF